MDTKWTVKHIHCDAALMALVEGDIDVDAAHVEEELMGHAVNAVELNSTWPWWIMDVDYLIAWVGWAHVWHMCARSMSE